MTLGTEVVEPSPVQVGSKGNTEKLAWERTFSAPDARVAAKVRGASHETAVTQLRPIAVGGPRGFRAEARVMARAWEDDTVAHQTGQSGTPAPAWLAPDTAVCPYQTDGTLLGTTNLPLGRSSSTESRSSLSHHRGAGAQRARLPRPALRSGTRDCLCGLDTTLPNPAKAPRRARRRPLPHRLPHR